MKVRNVNWKKFGIVSILVNILLIPTLTYVIFASPNGTFTISPGIYPNAASYTIWKENGIYYAKNAYGQIDHSGTDASAVIQNAIDSMSKGLIKFKAGEYTDVHITLKDGIGLIGETTSKVAYYTVKLIGDGTKPVISIPRNYATTNAELTHGLTLENLVIDGNGADKVLYLPNVDTIHLKKNKITNGNWGLFFDYYGTLPPPSGTLPGGIFMFENTITTKRGIYGLYITQNRIAFNWFENIESEVWINFTSPTKTWVVNNEFNKLDDANGLYSIRLNDDANVPLREVIFRGNYHYPGAGKKVFSLNLGNHNASLRLIIDDIVMENGGWDYPTIPMSELKIVGYSTRVSHNSGNATITAGTTTVTVTHGVYCPVPIYNLRVIVTPLENVGNFWVTNRTATTFEICVETAPASDIHFIWYAWYDASEF